MSTLSPTRMEGIYETAIKIVWLLKITNSQTKEVKHVSGFSIQEKGYILSCAAPFGLCADGRSPKIEARLINDEHFNPNVRIIYLEPSFNLALLKINLDRNSDWISGSLATDGTLNVVESLFHVGHPNYFLGSILVGHAAYPCIENVQLPTNNDRCRDFVPDLGSISLEYRIAGDVWNTRFFKGCEDDEFVSERRLNTMTPIIQISGINFNNGCEGGPILNSSGDIVGLLLGEVVTMPKVRHGYQIALHVTILRHFIEKHLPKVSKQRDSDSSGSSKRKKGH